MCEFSLPRLVYNTFLHFIRITLFSELLLLHLRQSDVEQEKGMKSESKIDIVRVCMCARVP